MLADVRKEHYNATFCVEGDSLIFAILDVDEAHGVLFVNSDGII